MDELRGSCLCGAITFSIENQFNHFQLCHCVQCQKTTGSAHASNLFTDPSYITWHTGQDLIVRYDEKDRRISNAFCSACGSRTPFTSHSGEILAVPAGALEGTPKIDPQANIFWSERASWYEKAIAAECFSTFSTHD